MKLADPYSAFVFSRVKWMGTVAEDLHHASTGLAGESVELFHCDKGAHEEEELGDMEFYLEHFYLALDKWNVPKGRLPELGKVTMSHYDALILASGNLLDQTKKCWIYEQAPQWMNFAPHLARIEGELASITSHASCNRQEIRLGNMKKLTTRYPMGFTNQSALLRADKAPGE